MTGQLILVYYSKERLRSVRNAVTSMQSQQFPQEATSSLLSSYTDILNNLETDISNLAISASLADISQTSRVIVAKISQIVQALGILQRSSSLRISYELATSVRRLCLKILSSDPKINGGSLKVLCASEWSYSPLYYKKLDLQEDMILLGLPACESDNALMLPIMAHEVGHTYWAYSRKREALRVLVEEEFRRQVFDKWDALVSAGFLQGFAKPKDIAQLKSDIFYSNLVTNITAPVLRQAEETFCDYLGLSVFSSAYMSSFAYFIGMGAHLDYSTNYCSSVTRSSLLLCAANKAKIDVPITFINSFQTQIRTQDFPYADPELDAAASKPLHPPLVFAISELTIAKVAEQIWDFAEQIAQDAGLVRASADRVESALKYFHALTPSPPEFNPREALCAAWKASDELRQQISSFKDPNFPTKWADCIGKDNAIRECLAKSLEVFELETGGAI